MYSEKTFKNYIFWIQVKRIFLMVLFTIIGVALGLLIGKILEGTVKVMGYTNILIIVLGLIFFAMSLLLTSGTGKEVQDGYWKIAVLRKLTVIQKLLENEEKPELATEVFNNSEMNLRENEQMMRNKIIEKNRKELRPPQEINK